MVQKVQMPERLDWALEGLVRAVLLHQPEDIYLFAAQHFDKIIQSRQSDDDDVPLKNYDKDIPVQEDVAKTIILPDLNESLISDIAPLEDEVIEQAVIESEDTTESEQNIIEEIISAEQANIVAEGVPETAVSELEPDGGVEESEEDKVPPTEEVELLDINPENTGPSDVSQVSEKIIEFEGAEEAEKELEVEVSTEAEKSVDAEDAGEAEEKVEAEEAEKSVDAEDAGEAEEKVEAEEAEKDVEGEDAGNDVEVEDAEKKLDDEDIGETGKNTEVDLAEEAQQIVDVDDTDEAVKSIDVEDVGEAENTVDIGEAEKIVDVEDTDEAIKSVDVEDVGEADNIVKIEEIVDAEKLVDVEGTDEAVNSVDVEDVGEDENVPEEAVKIVEVDGGEVVQTTEDDTQPEDDKNELNASMEEKIETVDDGDVISATDSQNIQNPEIILVDTEGNPGVSFEESAGESLKDEDQIESSALDENIDTSLDDTIQTEPEMNSEINILPSSLPEVELSEDNNVATESVEPLIVKENAAVTDVQPSESQDKEEETDEVIDDKGSIEISETKESNAEAEDSEFSPSAPPLEPESSENNVDSKDEIQTNEAEQNNLEDDGKKEDNDKNSEETENNEEAQKAPEEETEIPDSSENIASDTVDEAKGETIAEASTEVAESLDTTPAQDDDSEMKEEDIPQNDSSAETNVLKQDDSETSNDNEVTAVAQASEELEPKNSNEINTQITDEVLPSEPGPEKSDSDPETNNDVLEQEPVVTQETSGDSLIAPEAEDAPSLTEITSQEINESEVNSKSEVENSEKEAPLTGTDFLRSSGEFHDMVVVLPDDAFNTSNDADDIETLDSKTEDAQPTEEEGGDDQEEGAAIKIQASYRGYRTRKKLKKIPAETETSEEQSSLDEKTVTTNPEDETNEVKDVANDENSGDVIPTNNEVDDTEANEAAAATLIQSSYRGYRTRKNLNQAKEQKGTLSAETNNSDEVTTAGSADKNKEPSQDELNKAATKIQASARGYIARKKIARSNEAAITIQKNYRGYRARKNLTKSANTDTGTSNVPNDNTP